MAVLGVWRICWRPPAADGPHLPSPPPDPLKAPQSTPLSTPGPPTPPHRVLIPAPPKAPQTNPFQPHSTPHRVLVPAPPSCRLVRRQLVHGGGLHADEGLEGHRPQGVAALEPLGLASVEGEGLRGGAGLRGGGRVAGMGRGAGSKNGRVASPAPRARLWWPARRAAVRPAPRPGSPLEPPVKAAGQWRSGQHGTRRQQRRHRRRAPKNGPGPPPAPRPAPRAPPSSKPPPTQSPKAPRAVPHPRSHLCVLRVTTPGSKRSCSTCSPCARASTVLNGRGAGRTTGARPKLPRPPPASGGRGRGAALGGAAAGAGLPPVGGGVPLSGAKAWQPGGALNRRRRSRTARHVERPAKAAALATVAGSPLLSAGELGRLGKKPPHPPPPTPKQPPGLRTPPPPKARRRAWAPSPPSRAAGLCNPPPKLLAHPCPPAAP